MQLFSTVLLLNKKLLTMNINIYVYIHVYILTLFGLIGCKSYYYLPTVVELINNSIIHIFKRQNYVFYEANT